MAARRLARRLAAQEASKALSMDHDDEDDSDEYDEDSQHSNSKRASKSNSKAKSSSKPKVKVTAGKKKVAFQLSDQAERLAKLANDKADEDDEYVNKHYKDYFALHAASSKTSNNTLASLKLLNDKQRMKVFLSLPTRHAAAKARLCARHQEQFQEWFLHLKSGANLLLYGLGSKKDLIHSFAKQWLTDGPIVVVNGNFPALSVKRILGSICEVLRHPGSFTDMNAQVSFIVDFMSSEAAFVKDLYVIVHSLDGKQLASSETQHLLSLLAQVPSIHFIASVDHILAQILWNHQCLARFQFLSYDVTTYAPYVKETCYDTPIVGGYAETRTRGVKFVLQSLTPNHKDILAVLAEKQFDDGKKDGLLFFEFFSLCQDGLLVTNDLSFRSHLTEMLDHKLVEIRRVGGRERYVIPIPEDVVRTHILTSEQVATVGAGKSATAAGVVPRTSGVIQFKPQIRGSSTGKAVTSKAKSPSRGVSKRTRAATRSGKQEAVEEEEDEDVDEDDDDEKEDVEAEDVQKEEKETKDKAPEVSMRSTRASPRLKSPGVVPINLQTYRGFRRPPPSKERRRTTKRRRW